MAGYVENKGAKRVKTALLFLFIGLFVLVGFFLYRELAGRKTDKEELEKIQEEMHSQETVPVAEGEILPQFASLHEENPDLSGWLSIPGTALDHPVMYKQNDNDYYLSHDFYGKDSKSGLLVLDKRCMPDASGNNILIHGHNMKDGSCFGTLGEYVSEAFYLKHPTILFDTLYEEREYEIMSVFRSSVNAEDKNFKYYEYINIDNEEDFRIYYLNVKANSLYETGVFASYGDELITLSTCEYSTENGRLVVIGRRKN